MSLNWQIVLKNRIIHKLSLNGNFGSIISLLFVMKFYLSWIFQVKYYFVIAFYLKMLSNITMSQFPVEAERPQFASWNQTNLRQANIELRYLFGTHRYTSEFIHVCVYVLPFYCLSIHTASMRIFLSAPDMLMPELICKDLAIICDLYPCRSQSKRITNIFSYMLCVCVLWVYICQLRGFFSKHANQK